MDEFEMDELLKNDELAKSLKKAHRDMKGQKGRFIE
jgi:hypothetical protein